MHLLCYILKAGQNPANGSRGKNPWLCHPSKDSVPEHVLSRVLVKDPYPGIIPGYKIFKSSKVASS